MAAGFSAILRSSVRFWTRIYVRPRFCTHPDLLSARAFVNKMLSSGKEILWHLRCPHFRANLVVVKIERHAEVIFTRVSAASNWNGRPRTSDWIALFRRRTTPHFQNRDSGGNRRLCKKQLKKQGGETRRIPRSSPKLSQNNHKPCSNNSSANAKFRPCQKVGRTVLCLGAVSGSRRVDFRSTSG